MDGYALLKTAHVLLLVYWLGTDAGVFLGSLKLREPGVSPEARLALGRLMALLDMGPRTGVILMIPTGLALASLRGGQRESGQVTSLLLGFAIVVSLVWLALVWRFFALQQAAARGRALTSGERRFLRLWQRVDLAWRAALALAIAAATAGALLGRGFFGVAWLDWKLAAFGFILACGIAIRLAADDLPIALGEIAREGSTPERERRLAGALGRAYPWVLAIYLTLVVMTYISFAKPT